MSNQQVAGLLVGLGSVSFLVAAFLPISRVYATAGAQSKLELIRGSLETWKASQLLFALGAIATAGGIGWAILIGDGTWPNAYLAAPGVLLGIGAGLWSRHTYLRAVDPESFVSGTQPGWQFPAYTLLTIAGVAVAGLAFLQTGPSWLGLTLIIGSALFLVAYAVFRDLPPFVHYVLVIALAVELIRTG